MLAREAYLDHTLKEVEELAGRVNLLKSLLAEQTSLAKLKRNSELEAIRQRFAQFKGRVEELEEAPEERLEAIHEATELAWHELKQAVDSLLSEME